MLVSLVLVAGLVPSLLGVVTHAQWSSATTNPASSFTGANWCTPAYRSSTATGMGTGVKATSLTIGVPAGTRSGDVMLAQVESYGATITAPAGWTLVRSDYEPTYTLRQSLYSRVATAAEPSGYSWAFSASSWGSGGIATYAYVLTSAPVQVDAGATDGTGATTSMVAPSVTTTTARAMLVAAFTMAGAALPSITAPPGMTRRWMGQSDYGTSAMTDQSLTAAGTTGTRTATSSSYGGIVAQTVALAPAC